MLTKLSVEPPISGPVKSAVHDIVRATVDVLPHPSLAVKVLVCDLEQLLLETSLLLKVTVGVAHASVAVAVPNAASIAASEGLQD